MDHSDLYYVIYVMFVFWCRIVRVWS